jgi:hypothetical protein
VAVVLGQPVQTFAIHAAGDIAVSGLEGGVPADEVPRGLGQAQAQQGRRHAGPVADPGAGIAPRARLERGSVAIDQDVGRGAAEGPGIGAGRLRKAEPNLAEEIRPSLAHRGVGVFALSTLVAVYYRFEELLGLLGRKWLTERALVHYLSDRTYFHLHQAGDVPNPDAD